MSDVSSNWVPTICPIRIWRLGWVAAAFLVLAAGAAAQSAQQDPAQPASPVAAQNQEAPYHPITGRQRIEWFVDQTFAPAHLGGGVFVAAFGTARDTPPEYRGTWAGFGKRFASREAGVALSNAMEAELGAMWGEDPRYFREPDESFGGRVKNVVWQTFFARRRDGSFQLAYARYAAITGNNFISNAWRPAREADTPHALYRTGWGFLGRMGSNAFDEFWPDVKRRVFHHRH